MQTILTHKTVSMTELREPAKVLSQAGDQPVAVMNRNQVVGYFVPVAAVEKIEFEAATSSEVERVLARRRPAIAATLKYLEDK
jgi:antitoxin StbD